MNIFDYILRFNYVIDTKHLTSIDLLIILLTFILLSISLFIIYNYFDYFGNINGKTKTFLQQLLGVIIYILALFYISISKNIPIVEKVVLFSSFTSLLILLELSINKISLAFYVSKIIKNLFRLLAFIILVFESAIAAILWVKSAALSCIQWLFGSANRSAASYTRSYSTSEGLSFLAMQIGLLALALIYIDLKPENLENLVLILTLMVVWLFLSYIISFYVISIISALILVYKLTISAVIQFALGIKRVTLAIAALFLETINAFFSAFKKLLAFIIFIFESVIIAITWFALEALRGIQWLLDSAHQMVARYAKSYSTPGGIAILALLIGILALVLISLGLNQITIKNLAQILSLITVWLFISYVISFYVTSIILKSIFISKSAISALIQFALFINKIAIIIVTLFLEIIVALVFAFKKLLAFIIFALESVIKAIQGIALAIAIKILWLFSSTKKMVTSCTKSYSTPGGLVLLTVLIGLLILALMHFDLNPYSLKNLALILSLIAVWLFLSYIASFYVISIISTSISVYKLAISAIVQFASGIKRAIYAIITLFIVSINVLASIFKNLLAFIIFIFESMIIAIKWIVPIFVGKIRWFIGSVKRLSVSYIKSYSTSGGAALLAVLISLLILAIRSLVQNPENRDNLALILSLMTGWLFFTYVVSFYVISIVLTLISLYKFSMLVALKFVTGINKVVLVAGALSLETRNVFESVLKILFAFIIFIYESVIAAAQWVASIAIRGIQRFFGLAERSITSYAKSYSTPGGLVLLAVLIGLLILALMYFNLNPENLKNLALVLSLMAVWLFLSYVISFYVALIIKTLISVYVVVILTIIHFTSRIIRIALAIVALLLQAINVLIYAFNKLLVYAIFVFKSMRVLLLGLAMRIKLALAKLWLVLKAPEKTVTRTNPFAWYLLIYAIGFSILFASSIYENFVLGFSKKIGFDAYLIFLFLIIVVFLTLLISRIKNRDLYKDFTLSFLLMVLSYIIIKLNLPPFMENSLLLFFLLIIPALFIDKIIESTLVILKVHPLSAGIVVILESLTIPEILKHTDNPLYIIGLTFLSLLIYMPISIIIEKIFLHIFSKSPRLKKYEMLFLILVLIISNIGKDAAESEMTAREGFSIYLNGNMSGAMEKYNESIKIFPFNTKAYYYKGLAYYSKGEFNDSLICYDKCISTEQIEFE